MHSQDCINRDNKKIKSLGLFCLLVIYTLLCCLPYKLGASSQEQLLYFPRPQVQSPAPILPLTSIISVPGYPQPYSGPLDQYMHAMHLHTYKQNTTVHETINKTFEKMTVHLSSVWFQQKKNLRSSGTKESKQNIVSRAYDPSIQELLVLGPTETSHHYLQPHGSQQKNYLFLYIQQKYQQPV